MGPAELLSFFCLKASHFHAFSEGLPEEVEPQEMRSAVTEN